MAHLMSLTLSLTYIQMLAVPGFPFVADAAYVYPVVGGALIVSVIASAISLLRGVRNDTRSGDTRGRALLSNGLMTAFFLVIEVVAVGVIWLAFATAPDRLPFAPPAPGGLWAMPYVVTALITHTALGYLAFLFLVGVWLPQLGVAIGSRAFALGALVVSAVVLVGWETQHLPITVLAYAELLLVAATGDSLISALFPTATTNKGLLRAQNLGAIVFLAAGVVVIWLAHRLPLPITSLGPLTRAPNPTLYLVALGAMGLCVALTCLYVLVNPQPRRLSFGVPSNPGPQTLLNAFALEIPAVYLLWLTFATPPTSLPFPAPAAGSVWLWILPGPAAYAMLGALAHGIVSFLLIQVIFGFWLGALSVRNGSRLFQFGILLSFVVMTLGWGDCSGGHPVERRITAQECILNSLFAGRQR